ncbi:MAG TPA: DNA-processing protein DprA [Vicinamibacterales bacterium]
MDLVDLVALTLVPAARGRLVEAADVAQQTSPALESALDHLTFTGAPGPLREAAWHALRRAVHAGLQPLPRDSPAYPPRLRELPDHPLVLWVHGDVSVLRGQLVAIVGSRRASQSGLDVARRLGTDLAAVGLGVVSGLARGCDGAAHRGALDGGGVTIAVLGSGADVIYPPEHDALAAAIVRAGGAVVSELVPGTPPLPMHFPMRNRIISGLSRGVVVIEAGAGSGSLITASCACEQGREVMVVPGSVLSGRNRGGHQLIRDGAALVETGEDVLAVLVGAQPGGALEPANPGEPTGDPVLDVLAVDDPIDLDRICALTALPAPQVLASLAALEMAGRVRRQAGGLFVRVADRPPERPGPSRP